MAPNPLADLGAGLSSKSPQTHPAGSVQHGPVSQTERAFTAASTFMSGVMAISATQLMGAPLKMVDPKFYEAYMAFTKQSFGVLITTMTQWWAPTVVRISGDRSIPKQLFHKPDGTLECRFPKRLVMMANHQLYTDWLYLWWVAYTNNMHGYIYIILKESLKNIPIIGWGAQFYNFIFLKRKWEDDKDSFREHLGKLNNPEDPMWLLIFPEGTNLAQGTREKSSEWAKKSGVPDMKHQLLPRHKGLQFCLQNLKETTEWLYDCTIGYEGIPPGEFGQDVFTLRSSMFEGRPPKSVNMHFRRFKIADIPVNNDKSFEVWLRNRWREKDYLLEHFAQYDRFPEDDKWLIRRRKTGKRGPVPAKSIETQIKSNSLEEFLSIFAPLSSVMTVMYLFYGEGAGDPTDMLKMIGDAVEQQKVPAVGGSSPMTGLLKSKHVGAASKVSESTIPNLRKVPSAEAQRNMIQQYINAVRPGIEKQVLSPGRVTGTAVARNGNPPLRSAQKPGNLGQIKPAVGKAATVVPTKAKPMGNEATSKPRRADSLVAASASKPAVEVASKPAASIPSPAPNRTMQNRTFSTASTIKPSDSISAVKGPTTTKPAAKAIAKAPVKVLLPKKTTATGQEVTPALKVPANNEKKVDIDPAVLMKLKYAKKQSEPKGVKIDPGILARMKEGKK